MTKSLILALILGTASVAAAQPQRPYDTDHRDNYGDRYRDRDRDRVRVANQWVTLDTAIPNNTNRHIIKVYGNQGRLERVRLSIDSGRVLVRQIAVEFTDGTWQKMRVDRFLRAGEATELDLPGRFRAVQRVIVYTDPARGWRSRGSFSVLAARPVVVPQYGTRDWYYRH
jgi:hypothetical protein